MPFPDPPSNKTPASTPPPPPSLGITPLSGTKMSTLPAYLCPPVWLHPRTETTSSIPSAEIVSRKASMSAGPQSPHRASRDPCVHTKTCAPVRACPVPAPSPPTIAWFTKEAEAEADQPEATTSSAVSSPRWSWSPSRCLRICGNMRTSPGRSPGWLRSPSSDKFIFTLPTLLAPGANWNTPPLYVPAAAVSAACIAVAASPPAFSNSLSGHCSALPCTKKAWQSWCFTVPASISPPISLRLNPTYLLVLASLSIAIATRRCGVVRGFRREWRRDEAATNEFAAR
mmetsp:Transcript_29244/g.46938  ORF Transcript_29244/g.46938 Transcript_29244/m.46938 type:complete len:285 (-) Transcript_29244:25-879(-)